MRRMGWGAGLLGLVFGPMSASAQLGPHSTYEDVVISTQLACQADPRPPLADIPIHMDLLYGKQKNGLYCLPAISTYGETTPAIKAAELAAKAVAAGQSAEALDYLKSKLEFSEFGLLEHAIGDIYALDPALHDPDQMHTWRLYARTLNPALCYKHYQRYRDGDSLNPPDTAMAQMALIDGAVRGSGLCARTLVEIWEADLPGYRISDEEAVLLAMLSTLNGQAEGAEPLRRVLMRLNDLTLSATVRSTAQRARDVVTNISGRNAQLRALESHMYGRFDTGYIPMDFYYAIGLREIGLQDDAIDAFRGIEGRTAPIARREANTINEARGKALLERLKAQTAEMERQRAAREAAQRDREAREWAAYEERQAQYQREKAEYDRKMAAWRANKARKAAEEKRRAAQRSSYYSTYSRNRSTYSSTSSRTYSSSPSRSSQPAPTRRPQSDPTNNWHTKFWQNHNNQMNNYYKTGQFNSYW